MIFECINSSMASFRLNCSFIDSTRLFDCCKEYLLICVLAGEFGQFFTDYYCSTRKTIKTVEALLLPEKTAQTI